MRKRTLWAITKKCPLCNGMSILIMKFDILGDLIAISRKCILCGKEFGNESVDKLRKI
jgi:hypothetical protein